MTYDQITTAALKLPEPKRRSLAGKLTASLRAPDQLGGRPPKLLACDKCGAHGNTREMRRHRCAIVRECA